MSNPLDTPPKPGYLTSEFWSTMLVQALAAVTTMLDLLHVHWSHGLSGVQAFVPVVAIGISALLQSAYHDKRNAVKMDHAAQLARTYVAELENGYHEVEPVVNYVYQSTTGNPLPPAVANLGATYVTTTTTTAPVVAETPAQDPAPAADVDVAPPAAPPEGDAAP